MKTTFKREITKMTVPLFQTECLNQKTEGCSSHKQSIPWCNLQFDSECVLEKLRHSKGDTFSQEKFSPLIFILPICFHWYSSLVSETVILSSYCVRLWQKSQQGGHCQSRWWWIRHQQSPQKINFRHLHYNLNQQC